MHLVVDCDDFVAVIAVANFDDLDAVVAVAVIALAAAAAAVAVAATAFVAAAAVGHKKPKSFFPFTSMMISHATSLCAVAQSIRGGEFLNRGPPAGRMSSETDFLMSEEEVEVSSESSVSSFIPSLLREVIPVTKYGFAGRKKRKRDIRMAGVPSLMLT